MGLFFFLRCALLLGSGLVVVTTLLPFSSSHRWWIRGWDFPRVQLVIFGFGLVVASLFILTGTERLVVAAALMTCIAYQSYRIFPYTRFGATEMALADPAECDEIITLLSANVLMENDDHAALIREIDKVDPDILLLMETDTVWTEAVSSVLARYDTVLTEPLDNYYGLIFATRLKVQKAKILYLVDDETPSVFAELQSKAGKTLRFVGLHPRPPVPPGNTTEERDAQILFAARFAHRSDVPLVAMGDFNDAAWSDTAHLFKTVGEYLDPRVGRGFYASFNAHSKLLRCPIDHFYHTKEVAVAQFGRGGFFGSDHFPITAKICLDRDLAARLNPAPPELTKDQKQQVDDIVASNIVVMDGLLD